MKDEGGRCLKESRAKSQDTRQEKRGKRFVVFKKGDLVGRIKVKGGFGK
jgi:hypothetical protein